MQGITKQVRVVFLLLFCFVSVFYGQVPPRLQTTIDTAKIRIGEQLTYTIKATTDTLAMVSFANGQTFAPLEMVEDFAIDTILQKNKRTLIKKYALTQFDSGSYTIPKQVVKIDTTFFNTKAFTLQVADVVVDTTRQKLHPIKPTMVITEKSKPFSYAVLFWILGIALFVVLGYFLWNKKRDTIPAFLSKKKTLPAYKQAVEDLKTLKKSKYILEDNHKAYYTALTDILRVFLDKQTPIHALESTSKELLAQIKTCVDAQKFILKKGQYQELSNLLKTADLVKFAAFSPNLEQTQRHHDFVITIITTIEESLPELIEEPLDNIEQQFLKARKTRKRIYRIIGFGIIAVLFGVFTFFITTYGFTHVKDTILRHPTKQALEQPWEYSIYGYPTVALETPEVLKRQKANTPQTSAIAQAFGTLNTNKAYSISLTTTFYKDKQKQEVLKQALAHALQTLEQKGASNIITKQEEFTTSTKDTGIKTYGRATFKGKDNRDIPAAYAIITFVSDISVSQLVFTWHTKDSYAAPLIARVMESIDLKTQN